MRAQVVSQGSGGDVQRATLPGLLQRACACGGSSGLSGTCEECEKKNMTGMSVQAKL